ncbi:MAG TPA: nitronate monooxygenase [Haliangiales bacterium]|nr:nitronate monooxygenase [Haliangiales bacterium]
MATHLLERLGIRHPIVQAPMAGGITTPELVAAVAEAGALGSIGAPTYSAAEIAAAAEAVRRLTSRPFAINLFIPLPAAESDPVAIARVAPILRSFRAELGLPLEPPPPRAPEGFDAQFEAVLRAGPPVFSFTMGILEPERVRALHEAGTFIIGTANTADEAEALEESGVDAVCAQGAEAGGHRGAFLAPPDASMVGTMALVRQAVQRVKVPVLAAGGIMDGAGIAAALALGAQAAQMGTAFLSAAEAGTAAGHREALLSPDARHTVITRAFSGRQARTIRNRFTDALAGDDVPPFPLHAAMTADIRAAAAKQGRRDLMSMFAGQGAPLSRAMSAGQLVATLAREAVERA